MSSITRIYSYIAKNLAAQHKFPKTFRFFSTFTRRSILFYWRFSWSDESPSNHTNDGQQWSSQRFSFCRFHTQSARYRDSFPSQLSSPPSIYSRTRREVILYPQHQLNHPIHPIISHHLNTLSTLLNSTNASAAKSSSFECLEDLFPSSPTIVAGEDASSPRIVAGEEALSPRIVAGESVPGGSFFSVESLVMVWEESELENGAGSLGFRGFVFLNILGVGLMVRKVGVGRDGR